jgi:hypothetical protein
MVASTSTAVPYAQKKDGLLLRAVFIRTAQEVKDYTTKYEDQCKLIDALGIALNAPENKSVLDILAMRDRRLEAALVTEANAIAVLTNFCLAENSVLRAQSATASAALPKPPGAVAATPTTTTVPYTSNGISDKKIMKRKLPEPRDIWKDHLGKTHRVYYDTI